MPWIRKCFLYRLDTVSVRYSVDFSLCHFTRNCAVFMRSSFDVTTTGTNSDIMLVASSMPLISNNLHL